MSPNGPVPDNWRWADHWSWPSPTVGQFARLEARVSRLEERLGPEPTAEESAESAKTMRELLGYDPLP